MATTELKWRGSAIFCVHCNEILTADYDRDRGHADSNLYTHVCKTMNAPVLIPEQKASVTCHKCGGYYIPKLGRTICDNCLANELLRQNNSSPEPTLRYKSELTRAMDYLAQDPRVRFIGNQVSVKGNAMTGTLANVPREKLLEMPVAEELQMGMSIGLWMAGFIPVTIYPRFNFLLRATDQVVNHLDKFKQMSDGRVQPKVIIRTSVGSVKPLNPQCQHTGDFSYGFADMCDNIEVIRLDTPEEIFPFYQKALTREDGKSTLLVEWGDMYLTA